MKTCRKCGVEKAPDCFSSATENRCRDCTREASRAWYLANKERRAAKRRAWSEANRERKREIDREYYAAHVEERRELSRLQRARRIGAPIDDLDLESLWDEQGGACALCREDIDPERSWPDPMSKSLDHIIPLTKGGAHVQENVQWTHQRCNQSKGSRVLTQTPTGGRTSEIARPSVTN